MKRYKHIVDKHRPAGYTIHMRKMRVHNGMTEFSRSITIDNALEDRFALFVFLHECGHVHMGHMRHGPEQPRWEEEYEADQYAIRAMRKAGIAIPREALATHKDILRGLIKDAGHVDNDKALKYAFGKNWRKYK